MKREYTLCEALYQSLVSNIYVGNLGVGQSLPPLRVLCEQYHVGMSVVRTALQRLEDDGYILTSQGKQAVVTFTGNTTDSLLALLERRNGISDTYDGMALLLADPFYVSTRRCTEDDLLQVRTVLGRSPVPAVQRKSLVDRTTELLQILLHPLNNPLLIDLLFELRLFTRLPNCHLGLETALDHRYFSLADRFLSWLSTPPLPERDILAVRLAEVCAGLRLEKLNYLDQIPCPVPVDHSAVSFRWSASSGQSIYASVAFHLLNQIILGVYPQGSLLPPISLLMEQYGISSTTARSACDMLVQLGAVHTINGVGTRVLSAHGIRAQTVPNDNTLHKNLLSFLCALQILALTIRQTALAAFRLMDRTTFSNLHLRLSQIKEETPHYQTHTVLLRVLIAHSPNRCIAIVYRELFNLLFLGIYLLSQQISELRVAPGEYSAILDAARLAQPEALADALERLFLLEYHICWQHALNLGLPRARMPDPLQEGFTQM